MIRNNEKITNTEKPCVSVILPIYNMERYLPACLDSIIGQTHREIEIICVNDGSTDASMAILREYEAADSRIQIIDQENQGLSVSRNKGAEIAGGKYLYFMDSDDLLEPDALELCVEKMERLDLELVCFNAASFAESPEKSGVADIQNKSYFDRTLNEEKMYSGQELFVDLKQRRAYVVPVWTCVISRSAFLKHHLWFHPGIIHEDKPWMFATMMSLSRCGCINMDETPAALVYKASWPEEKLLRCTLGTLAACAREHGVTKTALVLVGDFLASGGERSRLYDPAFTTGYRKGIDT